MVRILDFHSSNPDSNSSRRTKENIKVVWLNGYNTSLSRCVVRVRIPEGAQSYLDLLCLSKKVFVMVLTLL